MKKTKKLAVETIFEEMEDYQIIHIKIPTKAIALYKEETLQLMLDGMISGQAKKLKEYVENTVIEKYENLRK